MRLAVAVGAAALVVAGVLPLLAMAAPSAALTVRYVDDDIGCDGQRPCYQSIQGAVDAADSGDILSLAAGRYTETVLAVDKALSFEGPGAGEVSAAPDASEIAVWAPSDASDAALTVDARDGDVAGTRVSGVRFVSAAVGIDFVGRRSGDPVPVPLGLPASALDTSVTDTLVADTVFVSTPIAVRALWADDLTVEQVTSAGGGIAVSGGSGTLVADTVITAPTGSGVLLKVHGDGHRVADCEIAAPGGRGIEIRPLLGSGLAGAGEGVTLEGNVVADAGGEGVLVSAAGGGSLTKISILGGRVERAGSAPGADVRGGVALIGLGGGDAAGGAAVEAEGGVADVVVAGVTVDATRRPTGTESVGAGVYAEDIGSTLEISGVVATGSAGPGVALTDVARARVLSSAVTDNAQGIAIAERSSATAGSGDVVIGGLPELGNSIRDNGGGDLVLRNETGSAVSTSDVDATYNDWGTAYAPAIEDRIHHRADSVVLGLVSYVPALGAPHELRMAAEPPSMVADGESTAEIAVTCLDVGGAPVPDGTLVSVGTDRGALADPGRAVEAESSDADLRRLGEWGVFDSLVFGPFSGDGYVRSYEPGSQLVWTFESRALLVRYGQAVLHDGRFRAEVDGVDRGSFSTRGPNKAWVDRVLASDLGAGTHAVTITVEAGEVNLDLLRGGIATSAGTAATLLQSGHDVGISSVQAVSYGANGPASGALDVPFTAGDPSIITLTLGTDTLPVGHVTTTVTVEARDLIGRPVPNGTLVELSSTLGEIVPPQTTTTAGVARAVLSSGLELGPGLVRATSAGAFASAEFTVTAAAPAELRLQPSRNKLPANSHDTVELAVTARDRFGNLAHDGTLIEVASTLGTIVDPLPATRDGIARTRLMSGAEMGTATVRAVAGDASDDTLIAFTGTDVALTKTARPLSAVVPGERVTFTLRYANEGVGSVYDLLIEDLLPTGMISPVIQTSPGQQLTRLPGRQVAFVKDRLRPAESGTITIALKVDTSLRWGSRTVVPNTASAFSASAAEATPRDNESTADVIVLSGAVYSVTMTAPDRVQVGGATGPVRASLTDRFGNPARDDTIVAFASDLGSIDPVVVRTEGGIAETTFTSGTTAGTATVSALTVDERGASAEVRVVPGPAASLGLISSEPSLTVGGETATITATLKDQYDNGISGAEVAFDADRGLLSEASALTGASGRATVTLRSSVHAGIAHVEARSELLTEVIEIPFVPGEVAGVSLWLDDTRISLGDTVLAEASVFDAFGNGVPGAEVRFESTVGRVSPILAMADDEGRAEANVHGTGFGKGVVRATAGTRSDSRALWIVPRSAFIPLAWRPR